MKIEIEIEDNFVDELLQNLPEYASCLDCLSWKYKEGIFKFRDREDDKIYIVKTEDIKKTFPKFVKKCIEGKYKFFSEPSFIIDSGNWDCWAVDGLIQETIFGEVVYG